MLKFDFQELTKLYYTIGEVAEMFQVNTSLIRFWEKEFDFKIAKKSANGNRLFSVNEIKNLYSIYQLVKIEGFTLEGAKKSLKNANSKKEETNQEENSKNNLEIIDNLEKIKEKLIKLKKS